MTDAPTPHRAASAEKRERLDAIVGRLMDLANAACQKGETAYTCGLTARSIAEDVRDIRRDLAPLLDRITAAEARAEEAEALADQRLALMWADPDQTRAQMLAATADRDRLADEVARLSVELAAARSTGTGRSEAEDDDSFSRELQAAYARNDAHGYACVLSGRLRQMDRRAKAANVRADQTEVRLRLMRIRAEAAEAERAAARAIQAGGTSHG